MTERNVLNIHHNAENQDDRGQQFHANSTCQISILRFEHSPPYFTLFFFNDTAPPEFYTLPLPDPLPFPRQQRKGDKRRVDLAPEGRAGLGKEGPLHRSVRDPPLPSRRRRTSRKPPSPSAVAAPSARAAV